MIVLQQKVSENGAGINVLVADLGNLIIKPHLMFHLYNKYGTKLWIIRSFENKPYLFQVGFWPSLKLIFSYELLAGRGFYKKIEKLNLAGCRNKFHPVYEVSEHTKITIFRRTWKVTKAVFEDEHFYLEGYSEDKLYGLEDYLAQTNLKNVRIEET